MSGISGWLLSIAATIVLGALVEIILSDGSLKRFVHAVFSLVVVCVIIAPLPELLKTGINLNFELNQSEIDPSFVEGIYKERVRVYEQGVVSALKDEGVENIKITIVTDSYSVNMCILQVIADKGSIVNHTGLTGTRLDEHLKERIALCCGISVEQVVII